MNDELFDVDRAAGLYPPKGWGWYTDGAKRRRLTRMVETGEQLSQWAVKECERLGVDFQANSVVNYK